MWFPGVDHSFNGKLDDTDDYKAVEEIDVVAIIKTAKTTFMKPGMFF